MAKRKIKENERTDYNSEIRALKSSGPGRLYFLWGPEDFLREHYILQLKKLCLPDGENSFCFKRFDGPKLDPLSLRQAIDAIPFMGERSLIELRDVDINRMAEQEEYIKLLSDIPDYCTVVFVQDSEFEPDGRLKFIKAIRKNAKEIMFTPQSQGKLTGWIVNHFADAGKSIELSAVQRLIFVSGSMMSTLLPEIEKIAAFSKNDRVTVADVDAVAFRVLDAEIFDMTELIAQRKINSAISVLADLLSAKENEPIPMLAALGAQMRKLYAARLAIDEGLGNKYIMEICGLKHEFIASKLISAARGFTLKQLIHSVELCAEAEYRMKSSSVDPKEIFKETVVKIASEIA